MLPLLISTGKTRVIKDHLEQLQYCLRCQLLCAQVLIMILSQGWLVQSGSISSSVEFSVHFGIIKQLNAIAIQQSLKYTELNYTR